MTPREAATCTLAEAFMAGIPDETWEGTYPFLSVDAAFIDRILDASPTLARWLELGAAWDAAGPEGVARMFHEAYERLAPDHGYETRRESAVPWADVPERNRSLMVATVVALAEELREVPR